MPGRWRRSPSTTRGSSSPSGPAAPSPTSPASPPAGTWPTCSKTPSSGSTANPSSTCAAGTQSPGNHRPPLLSTAKGANSWPQTGRQLAGSAAGAVWDVVQVDVLEYRVEVVAGRIGLRAELRGGQLVLDVEHGLAVGAGPRLQARGRVVALVVLPALLVDREIEVRLQVARLAEVIFQAHPEAFAVRQVGDRGVELLLGGCADGQAGLVLVGVHIVELDRIHARRPALVQPRGELVEDELLCRLGLPGVRVDARDVGVDVQPELIPEAADRLAQQAAAATGVETGVLRIIRPPGFRGAGVNVADHLVPLGVQRVNRRAVEHTVVVRRVALAILVDVDIEYRRRDLLPCRERRAGDRDVDESGARVDALAGGVDRAL